MKAMAKHRTHSVEFKRQVASPLTLTKDPALPDFLCPNAPLLVETNPYIILNIDEPTYRLGQRIGETVFVGKCEE